METVSVSITTGGTPLKMNVEASAAVIATGTYDTPAKLHIPGEGLHFVQHRGPSPWPQPGTITAATSSERLSTVVIVGAGISAADAIVAAMEAGWHVHHIFRGAAAATKVGSKFASGGGGMYREYATLVRLMSAQETSPL